MKNFKIGGFTLIELLVVMTIIITLSSIGLVSFINAGQGARDAKRKSDLETVRQALVLQRSDTGSYASGSGGASGYSEAIASLVAGSYISSPTPIDPKNDLTYFYSYTSGGTTFSLSATLEKDDSVYTLTNP